MPSILCLNDQGGSAMACSEDVSKEVYRAYYSIERHTRTLDEKDIRNGKVLYSDLDTDELLGEDMIPDMTSERVEDSAIYSILREKLHQYLGMLPPQDIISHAAMIETAAINDHDNLSEVK